MAARRLPHARDERLCIRQRLFGQLQLQRHEPVSRGDERRAEEQGMRRRQRTAVRRASAQRLRANVPIETLTEDRDRGFSPEDGGLRLR